MNYETAPVRITSLEESVSTAFTLNCTSVGSPASNVTWMKDGEILADNDTFKMTQYLRDGVTAEYNNLLEAYLDPTEVIGTYTCSVDNLASEPVEQTVTLQGDMHLLLS